jgi:hypothetical protein
MKRSGAVTVSRGAEAFRVGAAMARYDHDLRTGWNGGRGCSYWCGWAVAAYALHGILYLYSIALLRGRICWASSVP